MQIELFGCTSAGKSTLADSILHSCRQQGIDLQASDDFVLSLVSLRGVQNRWVRTFLIDLCSLIACLATWAGHRDFFSLAGRTLKRLSVPWLEKLNLARNIIKRVGIFEIVRRYASGRQLVLVDGGTLQIAHHLFVHLPVQTHAGDVAAFGKVVPLPDVAIHVTQHESVLIERTVVRGHRRIPDRSYAQVEAFVKQAVNTFDSLTRQLVHERRLLATDNRETFAVAQEGLDHPLLDLWLDVLGGELDTLTAETSAPGRARLFLCHSGDREANFGLRTR